MASVQSSPSTSTSASGPSTQHESLLLPESIGKRVDPTYSQTLHSRVKELLHTTHNGFPGSQPVYFETKHLAILEQEDYFVCEKSNGVRCLLFFVHSPRGPAAFMLDRNQNWYYIPNILLPVRGRDNEYLKETLMDGELLMEKDSSKKPCQYSVFDLMVINGSSVTQRSFNSRLGMLKQDVIDPYKASLLSQSDPSKIPPFRIEHKKMERSYGLPVVFDRMSKLQNNGDGIIWTPVKCPYVPNICEKLLKWKPPEKNTADFRINAKWSKDHKPIYSLDVLSHVTYKFFDHFQPDPDWAFEWKDQPPDGKIAEFWYDPKWKVTIVVEGYAPTSRTGGWRFVRFRDDKDAANEENDVKKILHNIRDGVSKEQLLGHMQYIRDAWKAREKGLPPPSLSHLQNRGRLSISSGSSLSGGQSLTTPTGTSPVLPSPAVDNNMYGSGYFYRDHQKSRHNSIDSASTSADRRSSAVDITTDSGSTEPHYVEGNHDTAHIGTQSLPGSRRQSLESSTKRDNNGNTDDDIERKRHKSLSDLDKSRKQQLEDNRRQVKEHLDNTITNDDPTMPSHRVNITSPTTDDIIKTPAIKNSLKSGSSVTKHTTAPISPTKTMSSSHSLPTVFEEELPKTNTRRRKTTDIGDNGYADEEDTDAPGTKKLQKVEEATMSPSTFSTINEHKIDDLTPQRSQQALLSNEPLVKSDLKNDDSGNLETTKQQQPTYTSAANSLKSGNDDRPQNHGTMFKRYDPARSPPPQASIPLSPLSSNSQQPGIPSNSQRSSSHSIHTLLTSSVEPIPPPPPPSIKNEPTGPPNHDQPTNSSASHSYKLSTILQENSQPTKADHSEHQPNEQQQQKNQHAQHSRPSQVMPGVERHKPANTQNSSSSSSVQFINFHADRPHSKGSPTSRQKAVFIQGEYHNNSNNAAHPSNQVQSPKYTISHQQQPHPQHHPHHPHQYQWQQPSGSGMISPQLAASSFNKHNSHLPSHNATQNSSTKSSPSSSPRGSRSGRQLDTWRVTGSSGHQQTPAPPQHTAPDYHYPSPHPPPPAAASTGSYQHISPAHTPHGYPPQMHQYSNYNTPMIHPEQNHHPSTSIAPPRSDRPYQQPTFRTANEEHAEYHIDPSKHQYPNHHPPPAPSSQPPYPTSTNNTPTEVPKRKSSKAKLDFILN